MTADAGVGRAPSADARLAALENVLAEIGALAVAVSGGVDSLTLATAAHRVLGPACEMWHATSPAVPAEATERVRVAATRQGWRLAVFDAGEFGETEYRRNPANRCFFCKGNLYTAIRRRTHAPIASGANLDDLGDYRPGLEAARNYGVRHPLVEAGIDKASVRTLARRLGLGDIAELPASPCLSSRVETGIRIEEPVLGAIHATERMIASEVAPDTVRCRVRSTGVFVELDAASLDRLSPERRHSLAESVRKVFAGTGRSPAVAFAPYRTGSTFIRARV